MKKETREQLESLIEEKAQDSVQSSKEALYEDVYDTVKKELTSEFAVHTDRKGKNKYDDYQKGSGQAFQKALPHLIKSIYQKGDTEGAFKHFRDTDPDFYEKFLGEQAVNQGGDKVIPRPLFEDAIPAMYNRLAPVQAGAQVVQLPSGRMDMGRQNVKSEAYYKDEGDEFTDTGPEFERISLQAKKLTAIAPISGEFTRRDGIVDISFVERDLLSAAEVEMNRALLRGEGGAQDEPLGILEQVDYHESYTGADQKELEAALDAQELSVLDGNHRGPFRYIIGDRAFLGLRRERHDGGGMRIFPGLNDAGSPSLRGYDVGRTNMVLEDADDSGTGGNDESRLYFGDWSSVVMGIATEAQLDVSEHSKFRRDMLEVRLIMEHDMVLRYTDALAILSESYTA